METPALNHINLIVTDVERSASFYEGLFAMKRLFREGDFIFLASGSTDVALRRGEPMIHPKFHFGFRLDSRELVDAWLERVREHGADVTHGPRDYGSYYTFTCRDPDGYAIEMYFEQEPRGASGAV
ncbi:MAG: VOC family protein [Myxococcales bacterium]|nr:VOC family protein [Myxococcales bacterium]